MEQRWIQNEQIPISIEKKEDQRRRDLVLYSLKGFFKEFLNLTTWWCLQKFFFLHKGGGVILSKNGTKNLLKSSTFFFDEWVRDSESKTCLNFFQQISVMSDSNSKSSSNKKYYKY